MTIRLIVNADDYGRSSGISRGIREAHSRGIVTSTTCMMNFPTTADDIGLALRETPELGLGVHLVLTAGRPLLPPEQIPTLVTETGEFPNLTAFMDRLGQINPQEAKAEWQAQIERFRQASGRNPTHLDSHHHSSYYTEGLFRAMLELAQEYGCAIRQVMAQESHNPIGLPEEAARAILEAAPRLLREFAPPTPDRFYATFYDRQATLEELHRLIDVLPEDGVYEIMCHPGYIGPDLVPFSVYAWPRERELAILTDAGLRPRLDARGIYLVSFVELNEQ